MDEIIDMDEAFIAAALRDDDDIPPLANAFERRCLANLRTRTRARCAAILKIAASLAAIAVFAVALTRTESQENQTILKSDNQTIKDVETVGVTAPDRSAPGVAAMSNECVVNADPGATALWKTLNAGQTQMAWEWPDSARSAKLTITGGGTRAEKIYSKNDAFPAWKPPVPENFNEDEVFTAKLVFYSGEGASGDELKCLVADGIGFVRGISGRPRHLAEPSIASFGLARK